MRRLGNTTPKSSTHILGSQDKVPDFADHRFLSSASTVMDAGARVVPSYPGAAVTDCPDVPRSADRLCAAGVKHLLARDVKHHPGHDSDHESRVTGVELALSDPKIQRWVGGWQRPAEAGFVGGWSGDDGFAVADGDLLAGEGL